MYRLRKTIEKLSHMSGRGTELVSVYIPKNKQMHEVIKMLQNEQGTASNIKSDTTRNHVVDSLGKIIQKLKMYKRTPARGLAVFCGPLYDDTPLGNEPIKIYSMEPPRELNQYLYRCDDHFHVEILKNTLVNTNMVGILSIDTKDAGWGLLSNDSISVIDHTGSGVPGKHRQGGQSAKRFQKLREMHLSDYYRRVADITRKHFLDSGNNITGIIVAGPGHTKEEFIKNKYLEYRLQKRIIGTIDSSYSGHEGVREAFEKSSDILTGFRLTKEKEMVHCLFAEINKRSGLAAYGTNDILKCIKDNSAKTVLVSDTIGMQVITKTCQKCGRGKRTFTKDTEVHVTKNTQRSIPCDCGSLDMNIADVDFIDHLATACAESGTVLEVLSGKSEYGMLLKNLGGVAAMLKYRH